MIKLVKTRVKQFWAILTLLSIELIIVLVVFFSALIAFMFLIKMVFLENKTVFDMRAFSLMSRLVSDMNTDVMQFFSFLGTHYFLIPANLVLVFYFLFIRKHRWYSIRVPVIALSSMLMMFLLKTFFQRPRPLMPLLEQAKGLSFPSGHATMSCSFYGLLIYMVYRSRSTSPIAKFLIISCLVVLIISIGVSRVYLRVHYASDVIAGFCVGIMWLMLSIWILNKIELYSKRNVIALPPTATN